MLTNHSVMLAEAAFLALEEQKQTIVSRKGAS